MNNMQLKKWFGLNGAGAVNGAGAANGNGAVNGVGAVNGAGAANGNGAVNGNGRYPTPPAHLIELQQVVKNYHTPVGEYAALKGVDLAINRGEFVAILGKSGSGKSTLINMITGIDRPTSGAVLVGDVPVHTLKENELARWRGRHVGIIFQFFQLLPLLSCLENVMLPMDLCKLYSPRARRERAWQLLEQVEMNAHAHKLPSEISGGQQQRVAIARALANDPPILTADEPTGNLDSQTADSVIRLFEALAADGKTVVMVTHDQDLAQRASWIVVVADGQISHTTGGAWETPLVSWELQENTA